MADKPYKVCNYSRNTCYGLVVSSLHQLKIKGSKSLGFSPGTSVSVVLEDDGTIIEDEAYFLCLPTNTKFMLLGHNEAWTPAIKFDGGTAWLRGESVDVGTDAVDSNVDAWCSLAKQLKLDLVSTILMSEADLQSLVDAPSADLASALDVSEQKTKQIQETLQEVLDRREEERQSKEILQLYLKVVEKEKSQKLQQESVNALDVTERTEVKSAKGFSSQTLQVLKCKKRPETRLSMSELQTVLNCDVVDLMEDLDWDRERTTVLVQACEVERNKNLQQLQTVQSLRANSLCHTKTRLSFRLSKAH